MQKSNEHFFKIVKRGTVTRTCLDVLRQAGRPMTVREIMVAALIAKGHNTDAEQVAKVRAVFNDTLRNQVGMAIGAVELNND
jgi:uroporphyrinogen-III decarboxylase